MSRLELSLLDHLPVGLCLLDRELNVCSWNTCLARWTGVKKADIEGRPIGDCIPKLKQPRYRLRVEQVLDTGLPAVFSPQIHGHVFPSHRRDGSPRVQQTTVTRVDVDSGHGIMILVEDVSELTRLLKKHRATQKNLELQREYLRDFASAAGHDLQAPLRHISVFIEMLRQSDPTESELLLGRMETAVLSLRDLIKDLLEHARAGVRTDCQRVELTAVTEKALRNLGLPSGDDLIEVGELPAVQVAEPAFVQLFQNLIGNAHKYRRSGEALKVSVRAVRENGELKITIADNGMGIRPDRLDYVFRPFRRLHSKSDIPGSGLGLATCKRIVDLHGGRIWAESELGEGSSFHISLPENALAS